MRVLFTSVVLVSVLAVGGLLAQSAGDTLWRPKTGPAPSLVPPGTPAPGSAESAAIAEVIAFEKATEAAVVRGDTAYLERALAPTFLFTHGDGWVDAKGSFLAASAAQPAYALLGKKGMPQGANQLPPIDTALVDGEVGFKQHTGGHTDAPTWPTFLAFAERYIGVAR